MCVRCMYEAGSLLETSPAGFGMVLPVIVSQKDICAQFWEGSDLPELASGVLSFYFTFSWALLPTPTQPSELHQE